jgi:hypothetical protein
MDRILDDENKTLESSFDYANLNQTNVSVNKTITELKEHLINIRFIKSKGLIHEYSYFNPETERNIRTYEVTLSDSNSTVNFKFNLKPEKYACLDKNLMYKLEEVVYTINSSFVYDMERVVDDKVVDKRIITELDAVPFQKTANQYFKGDYSQVLESIVESIIKEGKKISGLYYESTALIRTLIKMKKIKVYYVEATTVTDTNTTHAVVLCFDEEGNWVLLNGKRPREEDYGLIPKRAILTGYLKG